MLIVDTHVLVDVLEADPDWTEWSTGQLHAEAQVHELVINPIICAELSLAFATVEALDAVVDQMRLTAAAVPRPALFLAGQAFLRYPRAGGRQSSVLSDFFVGAHAAVGRGPCGQRGAAARLASERLKGCEWCCCNEVAGAGTAAGDDDAGSRPVAAVQNRFGNYPPAKPGALDDEPLKAACGAATAARRFKPSHLLCQRPDELTKFSDCAYPANSRHRVMRATCPATRLPPTLSSSSIAKLPFVCSAPDCGFR